MRKIALSIVVLVFSLIGLSQEEIRVTTWNIEHFGSEGRGLGGIGQGNLDFRTSDQINDLAAFIRDTLKSDILAVQEIALSKITDDKRKSNALDALIEKLGPNWDYVLGTRGAEDLFGKEVHNMQNAFIFNTDKVRLIKAFSLDFINIKVKTNLFDRHPIVGYFEAKGENLTDFLVVNVHLKSGQDNDENHLAAMIMIEQNLRSYLKKHQVKESDIAIIGDFNDNPFDDRYMDLLYRYMEEKNYKDLVNEVVGATRMDDKLKSIIDHFLINKGFKNEMVENSFEKYFPTADLADWRKTYSDHFPLSVNVKVKKDSDVDF